jgi:hypothetical protein
VAAVATPAETFGGLLGAEVIEEMIAATIAFFDAAPP